MDIDASVRILFKSINCTSICLFSFLGKRGVKDDILNFDPRNVSVSNRESVDQLLRKKADSFTQEKAAKASQVAGPLAVWVVANVKYSKVLEKNSTIGRQTEQIEKVQSNVVSLLNIAFVFLLIEI